MANWTDEQKLAIYEKNKNIIVSAGAGSGKTAVLTERVINHIENGVNVDDLLILTFTNAAAKEMKDRIRTKLQKVNNKDQLDRLESSYITTFDSYALSLIKKYNDLLNISDKITIIDDSILTLKKEEILNNIFDNYYASNNKLFNNLIDDFTLKDDKEIFNAIINYSNKLSNIYDKNNYLNSYLDSYYSDDNINKLIMEYNQLLIDKVNTIKLLCDNLSHYVDNDYYEKVFNSIKVLINNTDYSDIKRNIVDIKLPNLPRNSLDEAKNIKNSISKIIGELKDLTIYNDIDSLKESLLKNYDYVKIIIDIINEFDKEVYLFKKNNNAYEFIDIFKMAIDIVKDNTDVRNELKNKYYEILIDEYQDTNDLQDIFISYIEDNNVYMVGDIKQSIYRFRNANPYLFKKKYDDYSVSNTDLKIDLNKNFRSRSEVIDNINLIFNGVMDDLIGGASYFYDHQMVYGNHSYDNINHENYSMELLDYTKDESSKYNDTEIEIFTIAKDIKNKIDNKFKIMDKETLEERCVNYNDFVILIDRSNSFDLYKKIFEYLKIPLTILKKDTLSNSIDLSILKNIYNLILSIKNNNYDELFNYSFISVARSYLFELNDNDILKIIKDRSYASTSIYEICYELSRKLDELNNYELINLIIDKFNFYENIIKVGNINEHIINIDSIMNIANQMNELRYTPEQFKDYLDQIKEKELNIPINLNKDSNNTVKIMTIHNSKGLEYPICYFAGINNKFNIRELNDKFYFDLKYGFVIPYKDNDTLKNTFVKELLRNKYFNEEVSEKLRLFYVALTRAREKMIFLTRLEDDLSYKENGVVNNEVRISYRSFNDVLCSIYKDINKYIVNIDINDIELTKNYNKSIDNKLSIESGNKIDVSELDYNFDLIESKKLSKDSNNIIESKDYINKGLELHYLFEITDLLNPDYNNMNDEYKVYINNFIDKGLLNNVKKIYKEYEFMYKNNDELIHGIIDLLLVYDNEVIIVDYKLKNVLDDAYKLQLKGYKDYIHTIINLPIKTYLYSILDNELIEI